MAAKDPRYTMEVLLETLLKVWTMQDIITFQLNEELNGKDVAVDMYAEMWRRRCIVEFYDVKEFLGFKKDAAVSMDDFIKMVEAYFNLLGNPAAVLKTGPDLYEVAVYDCPYTTEVAWKELSKEKADHFNEAVQVACNTAIFEEWLRQAKLDKEWLFVFANQLCRYGGTCGFEFKRKIPE